MMKKNVHSHVLLQPPAYRLDEHGFETLPATDDDWWIIQSVTEDGVTICNPSGHTKLLQYDHIYKFTSDDPKQGQKRGFLSLLVQLYIQENAVTHLPTRPGEALPPPRPTVHDTAVEFTFPTESGIQQRLEAQGYAVSWCKPERVPTLEMRGAQVVIERLRNGKLATFKTRDGQVLVKRPR